MISEQMIIMKNKARKINLQKTQSLVDVKESLAELEELAYAAGGEVVGSYTQMLQTFTPATLIGKIWCYLYIF